MKKIPWELRRQVFDYIYPDFLKQSAEKFPKQLAILQSCADAVQFLTIVGGIGAAKSFTAGIYILPEVVLPDVLRKINGWRTTQDGRATPINVWIVGDNYDQPHFEFNYLVDAIDRSPALTSLFGGWDGNVARPTQGAWHARTKLGVKLTTKSWTNPESLHSEPIHIMLVCEMGLLDEEVYEDRLLPRIGRTNGYLVGSGTFEQARDFLKAQYRRGLRTDSKHRSFAVASWENLYSFPGGRDDPAIKMMETEMSAEAFAERCAAIPRQPHGLVHAYFSPEIHVGEHPYNEKLPVEIFVDPGANGYHLGAAQVDGRKAIIIDEYFEDTLGTSEKAIRWMASRPWASAVVDGAIDARAPEQRLIWESGEIWKSVSARLRGFALHAESVPVPAGIERVNTMLLSKKFEKGDEEGLAEINGEKGVPLLFFNETTTKRLQWELGVGYKYPRGANRRDSLPEDKHNHGAKGLAYWLVYRFGFVQARRFPPVERGDMFAHLRGGRRERPEMRVAA